MAGRFIPAGAGNSCDRVRARSRRSVHPRGCGEQWHQQWRGSVHVGSSPRVRGTGGVADGSAECQRFIPAGAGNRPARWWCSRTTTVHPRGCGEQHQALYYQNDNRGSSPRVRGTDLRGTPEAPVHRFIPAGAGNSVPPWNSMVRAPVHPRGCGEQSRQLRKASVTAGSSPRVRGTVTSINPESAPPRFIPAGAGNSPREAPAASRFPVHPRGCGEQFSGSVDAELNDGSSPRVRGTAWPVVIETERRRFIPAGAGNRAGSLARHTAATVHPRGCGEQVDGSARLDPVGGSSPRVRGTGWGWFRSWSRPRFIPAGAGNSAGRRRRWRSAPVHPRGCGEQSMTLYRDPSVTGSSPRVRGTVHRGDFLARKPRFIPAGAGNRQTGPQQASSMTVHPRGCGEQGCSQNARASAAGSSPRVRGTAFRDRAEKLECRFIPAGAGNRRSTAPSRSRGPGSSPRVRGTVHAARLDRHHRRFIPAGAGNSASP